MLEDLHPTAMQLGEGPLACLFDVEHVANVFDRLSKQDKKLATLLKYREFNYWVYDDHLNLIQMVEHLRAVAPSLNGTNPQHLAILLDCAWLYLLSGLRACEAIRADHVSDVPAGLVEYLLGGPDRLQEKQRFAGLLEGLQDNGQLPRDVNVEMLPTYFPSMRELRARVIRRSDSSNSSLRTLEYSSSALMGGVRDTAKVAFGRAYNEVAAKIAENVVAFLVQSAELDPRLLETARIALLDEALPERVEQIPIPGI